MSTPSGIFALISGLFLIALVRSWTVSFSPHRSALSLLSVPSGSFEGAGLSLVLDLLTVSLGPALSP